MLKPLTENSTKQLSRIALFKINAFKRLKKLIIDQVKKN